MKRPILFLAIVLAVLVSGCSQYAASSPPEAAAPAASGSSNAVVIKDFAFNPSTLTVKVGTTVKWTNEDSAPHTIKSEAFTSGNLGKGESFEFKFDSAGTYDYICGIHPSMKGRIVVE